MMAVWHCGVVVQLVRTPACHAGGREFESRRPRQSSQPAADNGSGDRGPSPVRACVLQPPPAGALMTSHGHGNPARHHQSRGLGDLANAGQAASANPQRPIVLAVALGLALCLPIGWATEFSVRRFVPIQGVLYRQHARLLYEHIPNSRKRFHHPPEDGSGSLLVTINAHGFRAGHFRESSSRRVLVIGDSFVSAEYSPESESFVYRLADQLRRTRYNRKLWIGSVKKAAYPFA